MTTVDRVFAAMRNQYFGGARIRFEPGTPKTITVNTVGTQVLPANPGRTGWAVINKSVNGGHLDYGQAGNQVSTSRGFPVAQNGGMVTLKFTDVDGGETVKEALFGINETAGGNWYIVAWELDL